MDLNYLLHRQQVERFRARSAACDEACNAHAQLAALYERAIEDLLRGKIRFVEPSDAAGPLDLSMLRVNSCGGLAMVVTGGRDRLSGTAVG